MKKPVALRAVLLATIPGLADKPENLAMYIDKGRIAARATGTLAFEYRYTLNIVVQDYVGDVDAVFVPLLAWVADQQPDLLDRGEQEPFTFESEILDGDAADISIDLELSERVLVDRLEDGSMQVNHLDEPLRIEALDVFAGGSGIALWQSVLEDLTGAAADTVTTP